jgi:TIGR03943 family protein
MNGKRRLLSHYGIRAILLIAFSFYIVHLVNADKLQYYIVPRLIPYVKYGAVGLFLLAVFYLYRIIQLEDKPSEAHCECGHEPPRSPFRSGVLYVLFAIPLLLGFALPDRIMGSDIVTVKGMNLQVAEVAKPSPVPADPIAPSPSPSPSPSSSPDTNETASDAAAELPGEKTIDNPSDELDRLFPTYEYSEEFAELGKKLFKREVIKVRSVGFLEMLTMLDMYKNNFIGTDIVISGFVYREDDMGTDQFVVSRLAMLCCSADSMPYGFLVKADSAVALPNDTWIAMTGKLSTTVYRGNEIIQLEASDISVIETPEDPYVYPYIDDFAALAEQ